MLARRFGAVVGVALLGLCFGCSPPAAPSPLRLEAGDGSVLEVETDPLALVLRSPGGAEVRTGAPAFAVGTVETLDPGHVYDPTYDDPVIWAPAEVRGDPVREGDRIELSLSAGGLDYRLALTPAPGGEGIRFVLEPRGRSRDVVQVRLTLASDAATRFYGLGEFYDAPEHHGRARNLRFDLSGETEAAHNGRHVRVPNLVTNQGLGLLLENTEPLLADLRDPEAAVVTVVADRMAGLLLAGDDPLEVLAAEQRAAGLPPLWAPWIFGPQLWRNAVPVVCTVACDAGCAPSRTGQDTVLEDAHALRALHLPASVMWVDAPWESGFNTFEFNPLQFPDPAAMIHELNALGLRVVVWASPFVDPGDDSDTMCGMEGADAGGLYSEARAKGYLMRDASGEPTLLPWRGTQGALVDFTNPEAFAWWKRQVRRVVDLGVDGFKLDFDEYVNPGIGPISLEDALVPYDGSSLASLHGRYSALFHRAHYEALVEAGHEPYLIGRTGNAADAAWTTAIWPGDMCNGFQRRGEPDPEGGKPHEGGLPAVVQAAISLSASLHPYFGSDTGGYLHGAPASDELFIRWIQASALGTVMQLGGGGEHHNPWDGATYGPEVLEAFRTYGGLHLRLFPYLYAYVARNAEVGVPILRPLGLAYAGDLTLADAPDEYLFGADLLVAPVVEEGARSREVAFPPGRWVAWETGEVFEGPATRSVEAPLARLPLFARAGAIVPLLAPDVETLASASAPGVVDLEDRAGELWARVFPGAARTFCLADGTCLSARATGGAFEVSVESAPRPRTYTLEIAWRLHASGAPEAVEAGGSTLTLLADRAAFDAASEGAFFDAGTGTLWVRARAEATLTLRVR